MVSIRCDVCHYRDMVRLYTRQSLPDPKKPIRKIGDKEYPTNSQRFIAIGYVCLDCGNILFDKEPPRECHECRKANGKLTEGQLKAEAEYQKLLSGFKGKKESNSQTA